VRSILQVRGADARIRWVDVGDFVKAGTVLASVRPGEYEDRVRAAEADLTKAQAAEEARKLSFERVSVLYAEASATKPEYDDSKAQFDEAVGQVSAAKAQLSIARTQLADSVLRAPCDGWIAKRNIVVGSLVSGATPAFSLIDTHLVRASFGVPDIAMYLVHLGQQLRVGTEAAGDFTGRVTFISPSADEKTRIYSVEVTLANPGNRLKAGMIATIALSESVPRDIVAVPLAAVLRSPQNPNAFEVMVPEAHSGRYIARSRFVQLGEAYGNNVAVISGVAPGDRVITTGAGLLHDGDALQLID